MKAKVTKSLLYAYIQKKICMYIILYVYMYSVHQRQQSIFETFWSLILLEYVCVPLTV